MRQFLSALVLSAVVATGALAQQDPKAGKILDQMSQKYQNLTSFQATFTQTLENPSSKISETMEGDILVSGNKFRLKMAGQEIINNGTTVYTYLKDENEVNVSDNANDDSGLNPTNIFSMYKKGYKYVFVEERKEDGRMVQVVELAPEDRNNAIFKIRLVIDKKDNSLKSWKMFNKNNGNQYQYSIKNFKPNVPVTASTFTFDKSKYKGVKVIDLR